MTGLIIVLVVIILLIALFAGFYNNFVKLRNRVDNAWAQIEVQLQRRHDLIPNLVETVKGYMQHESETFTNISNARNAAMSASGVEETAAAENVLTGALRQLFAVAEAYPELKANTNFLDLQQQLQDTENRISVMRQSYNDTVLMYNNAIQQFPGVLFAGLFHFSQRTMYAADAGAAEAPKVIFVNDSPAAAGTQASPAQQPTPAQTAPQQPAQSPANPPTRQ
jgi:LemA protein